MYCSISDAWNQENTMANLAKRFNKEYFPKNTHQQMEYFKVNDSIQGNDIYDSNHGNVIQKQNIQQVSSKNLNTNLVMQKEKSNKVNTPVVEINHPIVPCNQNKPSKLIKQNSNKKYSCTELVDKVLSCSKCKNMILQRLNINNTSISDYFNNLFRGTNKEIIILILIGLIIIILLDLFLRIGRSLN